MKDVGVIPKNSRRVWYKCLNEQRFKFLSMSYTWLKLIQQIFFLGGQSCTRISQQSLTYIDEQTKADPSSMSKISLNKLL